MTVGTIQQVDLTVDETSRRPAEDTAPLVESGGEEQVDEPIPEVSEDHTETADEEQEEGSEEEV